MNHYQHPWEQDLANHLNRDLEQGDIQLMILYKKYIFEHIICDDGTENPYPGNNIAEFVWNRMVNYSEAI